MVYNEKMAVAIKSAGKILREFENEKVYLPFSSEYSVIIKNLNSLRAMVKVEIDGQDVGDGRKFIINSGETLDLERFIRNDNLESGNRFKFIERTANIEKNKGIGMEDGIVRVSYNYEWWAPVLGTRWYGNSVYINDINRGFDVAGSVYSANIGTTTNNAASNNNSVEMTYDSCPVENEAGITVPGSISNQGFNEGTGFMTELKTHVIVMQLFGEKEGSHVQKPVTVKTKQKCTTCGKINKATSKFCTECGTSLILV